MWRETWESGGPRKGHRRRVPLLTDWRLWAGITGLVITGWLLTIQANRALIVAYRHPQVAVRLLRATQQQKDVSVKRLEVTRYLPGGTTEVTRTEELTDRSHTDIQTSSETLSTPILSPFQAPKRLVWAGWSIPERSPILGASARFLGPLWVGGWVRLGPSGDFGPAVMVTF